MTETSPEGGLRALFLNENISGHATVHRNLALAFGGRDDVRATIVDVPPRGFGRKVVGRQVPLLSRLDLDFQPLRAQLATSVVARRILRRELRASAPDPFDVLHLYTQHVALASTDIMRSMPTVVTTDTTAALNAYRLPYRPAGRFTPQSVKVAQRFERRVFASATLIVAKNNWVADAIADVAVPRDRIRVVPFGINLPPRPAPRLPVERPRITFVGYTLERKGGHRLLELHQSHLKDECDLVLVTTDVVRPRPGVMVRTDVRPGDGKLEAIFGETTAMVFPSAIDQAPNAVLEAMGYGVPVISARAGGMPEMIDDGKTGLLVEIGDDAALVAAIRSLVKDQARASEMGLEARERAVRDYDMAVTAGALAAVLQEAVERYGTRRLAA